MYRQKLNLIIAQLGGQIGRSTMVTAIHYACERLRPVEQEANLLITRLWTLSPVPVNVREYWPVDGIGVELAAVDVGTRDLFAIDRLTDSQMRQRLADLVWTRRVRQLARISLAGAVELAALEARTARRGRHLGFQ